MKQWVLNFHKIISFPFKSLLMVCPLETSPKINFKTLTKQRQRIRKGSFWKWPTFSSSDIAGSILALTVNLVGQIYGFIHLRGNIPWLEKVYKWASVFIAATCLLSSQPLILSSGKANLAGNIYPPITQSPTKCLLSIPGNAKGKHNLLPASVESHPSSAAGKLLVW